jgi:hypothetical protein
VLVLDAVADLCKVGPFILETVSSALSVLVQAALVDLWIVSKVTFHIGYLLVTDVLLLDVADDVVVKLCVEAEEHLRVVEVAALPHLFSHGLEQALVHPYLVDFELEMGEDLKDESKLPLEGFKHFGTAVLKNQCHAVLILGCVNFEKLLQGVALFSRCEGRRSHLFDSASDLLLGIGVDLADSFHYLLDLEGRLESGQVLHLHPWNHCDGAAEQQVFKLLLDSALEEDEVDLDSLAEGDDLLHFLEPVVHHVLKGGLLLPSNQVFRLDVAVDQDAGHVLVLILDPLASEGLFDQYDGLQCQAELLPVKPFDPDVGTDVHLASHHEVWRYFAQNLMGHREQLGQVLERDLRLFEDDLQQCSKSNVDLLLQLLYAIDLISGILLYNGLYFLELVLLGVVGAPRLHLYLLDIAGKFLDCFVIS